MLIMFCAEMVFVSEIRSGGREFKRLGVCMDLETKKVSIEDERVTE